ncbi:hypothetical protein DL96DRAFT_559643 [Flagelloscypha sp. PMI_526]|nr:hypothetical protein DL96DRAFT_559643 [Flagelloscypha sp. PMI_526]
MPPNDINGYPAYDEPDPYYHQSYGPPAPYPGPAYDHSYGAYEAPPHLRTLTLDRNNGPQHHGRGGGNNPGGKRGRQPQEKLPDHVIEERISRERPCRTLFIRNIKYETPSEDVRAV